jgi:hypothetical protein
MWFWKTKGSDEIEYELKAYHLLPWNCILRDEFEYDKYMTAPTVDAPTRGDDEDHSVHEDGEYV